MKPIDVLLDAVEWKPLPRSEIGRVPIKIEEVPVATHSGVLRLGAISVRVYQLSDGKRVIAEEDMDLLFGAAEEE